MNKLKVLGVAMLAIFAISAIAASAAQAGEFHSEVEKTFLFGEQEGENTFKTKAGNVKCKTATFDSLNAQVGAGSGTDWKTSTVIVQPQYSTCTAFGQTATVTNPPTGKSACDYHFTATAAGANVKVSGTPVPANPNTAACEIEVKVPSGNCEVFIQNQNPSTPTVTLANSLFEGKSSVKVTSAVAGITYRVEGAKGSICGEPEVQTTGEYIGSVLVRGYKSSTHTAANQVGISYK